MRHKVETENVSRFRKELVVLTLKNKCIHLTPPEHRINLAYFLSCVLSSYTEPTFHLYIETTRMSCSHIHGGIKLSKTVNFDAVYKINMGHGPINLAKSMQNRHKRNCLLRKCGVMSITRKLEVKGSNPSAFKD